MRSLALFLKKKIFGNSTTVLFLPQKTETNKRQFKPLPMATYKSSKVAFEQQIPSTQDELKPLPTFGIAPTVEAKVCHLISLVMNFNYGPNF